MENRSVLIPCRISPEVFRSFAVFEAFRRQKRWRSPALFAAIFSAFALACFILGRDRPQSGLIGGVLLVVGLGLPLFYVVNFPFSVKAQSRQLHLDGERIVYTVKLDEEGMAAESSREKVRFPWGDMAFAYRLPLCLALYPTPRQAFILPDEKGERDMERAWALITANLPAEKVFDLRR